MAKGYRPGMAAIALAGWALGTAAAPGLAQDLSTYATVRHPERFSIDWAGFYEQANTRTAALRKKLPHHLDLAFGDHPKQRLDLYLPRDATTDAPVLLFLHGGGFQEGDRAHYGFIAEPFAAHGVITAIASYRLASDGFHYPAPLDDARDALAWLHEHAAEYGGSGNVLYVAGHSAGAILAADLGADRSWLEDKGLPAEALKGIVPVSGVYDLRPDDRPGYVDAYAPTASLRRRASPSLRIDDPVPAALLAAGSLESGILPGSRHFARELSKRASRADFLVLDESDHNHTVLALADGSSLLFRRVLGMMNQPPEKP